VDSAMGHPDVFGNPEVLRIMQGIQSEWSMMEQKPPPRRRSRSPRDQGFILGFFLGFYDILKDLIVIL